MANDRHVIVGSWADIDGAPSPVSEQDKQHVATIINDQSWDHIVWVPEWLLDEPDKDVQTVESSAHLAVGNVSDYSEKAWCLNQTHIPIAHESVFLPKSQVVHFERLRGVGEIETPQRGLTAFAGDGDD